MSNRSPYVLSLPRTFVLLSQRSIYDDEGSIRQLRRSEDARNGRTESETTSRSQNQAPRRRPAQVHVRKAHTSEGREVSPERRRWRQFGHLRRLRLCCSQSGWNGSFATRSSDVIPSLPSLVSRRINSIPCPLSLSLSLSLSVRVYFLTQRKFVIAI